MLFNFIRKFVITYNAFCSRPSWERRAITRARAGTRLATLGSAILIVRLFIKNHLLFTIAPGISNLGLGQLTSVTHFDEQNME